MAAWLTGRGNKDCQISSIIRDAEVSCSTIRDAEVPCSIIRDAGVSWRII